MRSIYKHLAAFSLCVLISTPLFAINGIYGELASGRIPWVAGSIFISALWATAISMLVLAPVASITAYLVENKISPKWFLEPMILLGVLAVYTAPISLYLSKGSPTIALGMLISLFVPALIYFLILRAIGLREHL